VAKRLWGVLAVIGLALAAAFVKGIVSKGINALGWVGWVFCFGSLILMIISGTVMAISGLGVKPAPDNPDSPPPD
jgi:hypothetical protein